MYNPIECMTVLQEVVNTSHDTENPKAINPNPDDGDDTGPFPTNEPAEDTE